MAFTRILASSRIWSICRTLAGLDLSQACREVVDKDANAVLDEVEAAIYIVASSILRGEGFSYDVPSRAKGNQVEPCYHPDFQRDFWGIPFAASSQFGALWALMHSGVLGVNHIILADMASQICPRPGNVIQLYVRILHWIILAGVPQSLSCKLGAVMRVWASIVNGTTSRY